MIVLLDSTGRLDAAYVVRENDLHLCSWCGRPFHPRDYFTVKTVYHPKSGQEAKIALCRVCSPFEIVSRDDGDEHKPAPLPLPKTPAIAELPTEVMCAVKPVRASTPPPPSKMERAVDRQSGLQPPASWERTRKEDTPAYIPRTGMGFVHTLKELVK